jgi:hypothetical protein
VLVIVSIVMLLVQGMGGIMSKKSFVHGNDDGYLDVRHVSVQDKSRMVTRRRAPRNMRTFVMAYDCDITLDQMRSDWAQGVR